jgi:putative NADH-flavin reductase
LLLFALIQRLSRERQMKVVVFGSTGGTGREIVRQALELGHEVTAFARHAQALGMVHERLRVVEGDALRQVSVEAAIEAQDAVLSALGTRSLFKYITLLSQSTELIVSAMERRGVRRLIVETSLGVGDSRGQLGLIGTWIGVGVVLARIYADKERQEKIIAARPLDWTIVRPAMLTNGSQRTIYRTWSGAAPESPASRISRADVAHLMLSILSKTETYHRAINCSY